MERLLRIGFERVGRWVLGGTYQTEYCLDRHREKSNLLYSFVIGEEVKYIGKTTKTLHQRMGFYRNPGMRQSTNIRVKRNIIDALNLGQEVDIFVFVDNGLLFLGEYHINVAAGIEDSLITAIQPPWNLRGINTPQIDIRRDEIVNDEPDNNEQLTLVLQNVVIPIAIAQVSLGQSYYNKGFINLPVEQSNLLGSNNDRIDIHLNNERVIVGYINRDANRNNTPRIMGGVALRNWIQDNFTLNDNINIEILDIHSINIPLPN